MSVLLKISIKHWCWLRIVSTPWLHPEETFKKIPAYNFCYNILGFRCLFKQILPFMKFCAVLHRITGTGQKHDQKYLLRFSCFENNSLLFADYQFCLLCVTPKAQRMKLKTNTMLLNTHRQSSTKKKKKRENKALLQISYVYWDVEVVCVLHEYACG